MIYLKIIFTSLGSIVTLFVLTKIMGNKQMSQINMFDYINSITIGSIAAEMAISDDEDFVVPLIAMLVYGAVVSIITIISNKSLALRRFFAGSSIVLMDDNKIYMKNLKRAKLDLNEFLVQLRINGYFDISEIHSAYMEPNGMLSILPKEGSRPVTIKDMKIQKDQSKAGVILILDGYLLKENLHLASVDEKWLNSQIKLQGAKSISDVALASVSKDKTLTVFTKNSEMPKNDYFE